MPGGPAATAVLVRDATAGLEVLMTRRDTEMRFMGGYWVFPGGRVEVGDGPPGTLGAARDAAARETREEAGLEVVADLLIPWSRWEPPPEIEHRFDTWFFVGAAPEGEVSIDDNEAREHAWWRPADVLAARDAGRLALAPPTWVTLHQLSAHRAVEDVLARARATEPEHFVTRIVGVESGAFACWRGDAAYEPPTTGGRHRLWMGEGAWRYERD